jgi:hypothetical protein
VDRVSSANYQTISGRRTWQNKNLGAAITGTTFDQVFFAGIQESIIALAEQVGITPTDATLGSVDLQALQGVRRIAGGNVTSISGATATLTADNAGLVLVSAAANNVAITLPLSASADGQKLEFTFVRTDSSGNTVTVTKAGSDTSFPTGLFPISIQAGGALHLRGDGISNWFNLSALSQPAHGVQVFSSSASFTVPAAEVDVEVWGGGGGAQGSAGSNGVTAGAGGGYARKRVTGLTIGASVTVTIGAGGPAGANGSGASGSTGGTSSFGAVCSATGGSGGLSNAPGAPAGAGSGGDVNGTGGGGPTGAGNTGGAGGSGAMGGGGGGGTDSGNGTAGGFPGGGGGGAATGSGNSSGAGAGGLVVVRW